MKKRVTKFSALFLALLMLFGTFSIGVSAASSDGSSYAEILAALTADSYSDYLAGVKQDGAVQGTKEIKLDIGSFTQSDMAEGVSAEIVAAGDALAAEGLEGYLVLPDSGTVTWTFDIAPEDAGLYGIRFEFYQLGTASSNIERKLFVDGKVPFNEARTISFTKTWKYDYTDKNGNAIKDESGNNSFREDTAGNDIRAEIESAARATTYECTDKNGFYNESFQFYFKEGTRTISLVSGKESFAIKSITLFPVEEIKTLEDMQNTWKDYPNASVNDKVYIRAESPDYVSDSAVYPSTDRSSAITSPIDSFSQKINVIGASGYSTSGQWAEYQFTVPADGIYNIAARFKQSALQGMFASRIIKLASSDGMYGYADGTPKAPYLECYYTRFNYSNDWQVEALNSNGEGTELAFYFKAGVTYTMRVEVGLGDMAEVINTLQSSLTTINNCYLEILKLTGANPDEYRDYGFKNIMPATIEQLGVQSKVLNDQIKKMEDICGSTGSNVATLRTIADLLERMWADEKEIAGNLSNLKSYIGTLGTWINTAKSQSVTVDYYEIVSPDAKLGKANAGFFKSIWFEICSFVASFFVDYDAMGVTEDANVSGESISVWIAYGRDQSQIWKNLITNDFTVNTGIPVDLKLVATGTLLPSVLAKQGPDAYIGLAAADVINYAIRGAVEYIEHLPGYADVLGYYSYKTDVPVYNEVGKIVSYKTVYYDEAGNEITDTSKISFNAATMIPVSLYDAKGDFHTYGLPEQASISMMFYRKDILAQLEIDVPQTWDDVLAAVPVLQANNMMVGLAYEPAINMFLYQFGGNLWRYTDDPEYAGAAIGLDTDIALNSFQYCTRLYTDYSFPYAYDGPNRFRTGEIPLLIADYVTTYNQLVVFATEISGLWEFTSVPGMIRDDGTINSDSIATVTATVMLNGCSDVEKTWTYMQWQARGDVQAAYGNEMVALVGPAAKYATANIQGIREHWSSAEVPELLNQFDHLAAIPNYPGSYIIARYTKFAFMAALNEGADAVTAMQDYISIINQEISRKRKEFDLYTLGNGQTPEDARLERAGQ